MGMGSGSGGVPIGGKGVPTVPMGNGSSSPNVAAPSPAQSQTRSQYSQPFQRQYMPPPQQQFSMAAPPRQYVQQPYNLSGAMNTTNLGQQQQMSRPITTMPINYPSAQTQQMQQPPRGLILSGFDQPQQQQQFQQQYFRPQQYQQDPYMNYMRNQQQAMQQQAVQQGGIRQLQQADILRQQQAVQAAQSPEAVAQRAVAQGGSYTPEPFVPQ